MATCKHEMDPTWCADCRRPVRRPVVAGPIDLESIRELVLDAEDREAVLETIPGHGVPAESPWDHGGQSKSSTWRREKITEAMLLNHGDSWSLDDTRQVFELKGFLSDTEIGELLGRTVAGIMSRRLEVRAELGIIAPRRRAS